MMTTRRRRRGAFDHTTVSIDLTEPASIDDLKDSLQAASPRGRIEKWKPHAERLQVGLDDLREAESLIDAEGSVADMGRFDLCILRVVHAVDLAQIEATITPEATEMQRTRAYRSHGGDNSHGLEKSERLERNRKIQLEIDRLCAQAHLSYNSAIRHVVKEFDLSPDHVKKITVNPRRKS